MEQYISKACIKAEIEKRIKEISKEFQESEYIQYTLLGKINALENLLPFLDNLEVKEVDLEKEATEFVQTKEFVKNENPVLAIAKHFFELGLKAQSNGMIEALRTEYEKGRADVIADTISWLANVWPQYCSNPNIIDAYKESVVKD